jgi:radical SAM superfamily enzyme YgiQ (UPF0313 family)
MNAPNFSFEQGPIRPPNEARSLLLRLTRNCPWNQCLFCPVYKNQKFSLRSVEEIKTDIQTAKEMAAEIKTLSWKLGHSGHVNDQVINYIFNHAEYTEQYRSIAAWLFFRTDACFLQDADNLILKTQDLVEILKFLKDKFPEIKRVTTYSRSRTVIRKSVESLRQIRQAGLDRVHLGLETGYDPLLKLMKKGVTGIQHIEAGQKLMQAGMEVSEYVMPGLGGQEMWREHAIETAKVLNQINPHFIRLRSLRVPPRVPLHAKLKDGSFTMPGKLPEGKDKLLEVIKNYQALPNTERLIYRAGRRGGVYRSIDDLQHDRETYQKIKHLIEDIQEKEGNQGVENLITQMVDRYI